MIQELNNAIQVSIGHTDETLPILYSSLLKISCCALQTDMDSTERGALIDVLELLQELLPSTGQMVLSPIPTFPKGEGNEVANIVGVSR